MNYRNQLNTLVNQMATIKKAQDKLRKLYNSKRDTLIAVMKRRHLKHYDNMEWTATLTKASQYYSFSTPLLRKYEPQTYKSSRFQILRHRNSRIQLRRDK